MIHPSYKELIDEINKEVPEDEEPVVTSRYSIVLASSKRARQITAGDAPLVKHEKGKKALSIAVQELYEGKVNILPDTDEEEDMIEAVEEIEAETIEVAEDAVEAAEEVVETAEEIVEAVEE